MIMQVGTPEVSGDSGKVVPVSPTCYNNKEGRILKMRRLIKVTKKNISKGEREECFDCPVALALQDHGIWGVGVNGDYFEIPGQNRELTPLPERVKRFINKFDKTGKGKPFNFYYNF